jgi:hypothetical protein
MRPTRERWLRARPRVGTFLKDAGIIGPHSAKNHLHLSHVGLLAVNGILGS